MATRKEIQAGIGNLTARLVTDILGEAIPSLESDVASLEIMRKLKEGNLDEETITKLKRAVGRTARDHLWRTAGNPFYKDVKEVARSLVGATIVRIKSPGNVEAGMITEVGAYDKNGDTSDFKLSEAEPGTVKIWKSSQRGGYGIACIAAHPEGEFGYIALFGATISNQPIGMKDIVDRFGFEDAEGIMLPQDHSPIKLGLRNQARRDLTENVRVYASKPKGEGCIAAYKLGQK